MKINKEKLLKELRASDVTAECPCGGKFRLRDALLFDGLEKFPSEADEVKMAMIEFLKGRAEELKGREISAGKGAEKKAIEVGMGKILEKILPACPDFKMPISDCRTLYEPIDVIAFNGLTAGRTTSISFLEIKTGQARLNKHQRQIKDVIEDGNVEYRRV